MKFSTLVLTALAAKLALAAPVLVTDYVTQVVTVTVTPGQSTSTSIESSAAPASSVASTTLLTSTTSSTPAAAAAESTTDALVQLDEAEASTTTTAAASTSAAAATTSSTSTAAESTTAAAATTSANAATTASSTSTSAAASSTASGDFESAILARHNEYRADHGVSALTWDDTLATYAQNYADKYDCSGTLTHSGGAYGENLALGYTTTGAVDVWYNEGSDYDYSTCNTYDHFTQVIWKSTTKVGCGYKYCSSYWGTYIVCSYDPAGNVIGECSSNVLEA